MHLGHRVPNSVLHMLYLMMTKQIKMCKLVCWMFMSSFVITVVFLNALFCNLWKHTSLQNSKQYSNEHEPDRKLCWQCQAWIDAPHYWIILKHDFARFLNSRNLLQISSTTCTFQKISHYLCALFHNLVCCVNIFLLILHPSFSMVWLCFL